MPQPESFHLEPLFGSVPALIDGFGFPVFRLIRQRSRAPIALDGIVGTSMVCGQGVRPFFRNKKGEEVKRTSSEVAHTSLRHSRNAKSRELMKKSARQWIASRGRSSPNDDNLEMHVLFSSHS